MIRIFGYIVVALLIVVGFTACSSDQECYEPVDVKSRINFSTERFSDSLRTSDGLRDSLVWSFVDSTLLFSRVQILDVSTPIIFPQEGGSIYPLLNPDTNAQRYSVQFDSTIASFDTLTLFYKTNLHFISNACGYTYYYNIDSVHCTTNVIDSMSLRAAAVTNDAQSINVSFYFFNR